MWAHINADRAQTGLTLSISQNNNAPELDAEFKFYPVTSNFNVPS